MSAAEQLAPMISEPLSWDEICAQYPDQWVCLVEMEFGDPLDPDVQRARVVGCGKTRKEPLAQARPWRTRYPEIGHFFTGPLVSIVRRFG
jgi:hypothetical protein